MKVEWFFNGKPLPFKNRFTPIYDFGYVAMNFGWVYPEDSGEYVCRATNLYGMDETRGIIKTTAKPEPQAVAEGEVARFCCRGAGYPKPRVMWLLNGHTVINGSKHKLLFDGMWHFDIPKCRDVDAGKVVVIARNSCGEAYSTTTLEVTRRQDDYRSVLRHNVKRDYMNSKE